jgi:hypothetical protein
MTDVAGVNPGQVAGRGRQSIGDLLRATEND